MDAKVPRKRLAPRPPIAAAHPPRGFPFQPAPSLAASRSKRIRRPTERVSEREAVASGGGGDEVTRSDAPTPRLAHTSPRADAAPTTTHGGAGGTAGGAKPRLPSSRATSGDPRRVASRSGAGSTQGASGRHGRRLGRTQRTRDYVFFLLMQKRNVRFKDYLGEHLNEQCDAQDQQQALAVGGGESLQKGAGLEPLGEEELARREELARDELGELFFEKDDSDEIRAQKLRLLAQYNAVIDTTLEAELGQLDEVGAAAPAAVHDDWPALGLPPRLADLSERGVGGLPPPHRRGAFSTRSSSRSLRSRRRMEGASASMSPIGASRASARTSGVPTRVSRRKARRPRMKLSMKSSARVNRYSSRH